MSGEPLRKRIDLSFLQIPTGDSLGQSKHWMYEAQISFLLVGSDDLRWVGYAFDDTYFNDDKTNSVHKDEDPIASDAKPNAHLPIMNARVYFLKILNIRSAKVLREWESLVWTVKREIDTHVCLHHLVISIQRLINNKLENGILLHPITGHSEKRKTSPKQQTYFRLDQEGHRTSEPPRQLSFGNDQSLGHIQRCERRYTLLL